MCDKLDLKVYLKIVSKPALHPFISSYSKKFLILSKVQLYLSVAIDDSKKNSAYTDNTF